MKKRVLFIFLIFAIFLYADINEPVLAISAGNGSGRLIYDQEKGLARNNNEILLACYRINDNDIQEFELVAAYSDDSGNSFEESILGTYDLSNYPENNLLKYNRFAPVVKKNSEGNFLIFYNNLDNSKPMIAKRNASTGEYTTDLLEIPGRLQVQYIKNDDDFQIVTFGDAVFSRPISRYSSFTHTSYTENDEYEHIEPGKFWGRMEEIGYTHSNGDIWVQNGGGGPNNGWPTFYEMVTTTGQFLLYPTGAPLIDSAPMEDIFQGGYQENVGYLPYPNTATEVRENGFFLSESPDHDILYVKINGSTATCRYADKYTEEESFVVYNIFPDDLHAFPIGDSIWTNEVNIPRLNWDDNTFNLTVLNSSVFVDCQLWIEGTIAGYQTWACSDTIFITNDLLYESVTPNEEPELDTPDMLGLISEERIYVQYKNYDPDTGMIQDPNTEDIYLYGSFAALGDGDIELYGNVNTHYEGIFSFYYQHPHGSTPGFTYTYPGGEEWEIEFPDFHKFIFPPDPYWTGDPGFNLHSNAPIPGNNGFATCGYPYERPDYSDPSIPPYGTGYPFYNPVYPEGSNQGLGERGTMKIYGGIQQYRPGFIHRSGCDPNNHQDYTYDLENWLYGGTHGPTGYDFDKYFDVRLFEDSPPHYPHTGNMNMGLGSPDEPAVLTIYDFDDVSYDLTEVDSYSLPHGLFRLIDNYLSEDELSFLLIEYPEAEHSPYILKKSNEEWTLMDIELSDHSLESIDKFNQYYLLRVNDNLMVYDENGEYFMEWSEGIMPAATDYTSQERSFLHFIIPSGVDQFTYHVNEMMVIAGSVPRAEYEFECDVIEDMQNPDINVLHNSNDDIVMQILDKHDYNNQFHYSTYLDIYISSGSLAELPASDEEILPANLNLTAYPNPFNPQTQISFELAENCMTNLIVYNMKGQLVETLRSELLEKGKHNVIWDVQDCASGMYMIKLNANGKTDFSKVMLMK